MHQATYKSITPQDLKNKLNETSPNNEDRREGYALVNVLGQNNFNLQHIPGSINISKGEEDTFEEKFDKNKEIIVYCASPQCQASPTVAMNLVSRGFTNVIDYEDGMSEWINAGYEVAGENK